MLKKKILYEIIFILALAGIIVIMYFLLSTPKCEWTITNCCTENAGAYWECVNMRTYTPKINCSAVFTVCPQVISPKPNLQCSYDETIKNCTVKP